jgi:hypothetical protein
MTSRTDHIFVQDTRSGSNEGLTGLAYNTSGLVGYYVRHGGTGSTSITLATSTLGTWTSGAFKEVDATNLPGIYEVGYPNDALASGASYVVFYYRGAANMGVVTTKVQLDGQSIAFQKNNAFSNYTFMMFDSSTNAPKTGLTVTCERSIDGGAFAACANSPTEVANGLYKINLAATDLNGDNIALKFTSTGAHQTTVVVQTVN